MFFKLSHNRDDDFTVNIELPNGLIFNCDAGWRQFTRNDRMLVFKGYHTEDFSDDELFDRILKDPTPRYQGNFCLAVGDAQHVTITHSHTRSFPLVHHGDTVTNLLPDQVSIGSNEYLTVSTQFEVTRGSCQPLSAEYPEYTLEQGLDAVHEIIANSFERFLSRNNRPLKVFLTGGIDTTMVHTYLKHFTKNFELADYEYHKFTHFYRKNQHKFKKFWAYNGHFHTWGDEPTVLVTGGHGDDAFLRGGPTVNLMLMHHGEDIQDLLEANPTCHHHKYLHRYDHVFKEQKESKLIQSAIKSDRGIKKYILNRFSNDYQHWHIDQTLFFTPLSNIKILQVMMGMPKEVLVQQALHGEFNRMLIERIDPDNLKLISREKNHDNLENL